MAMPVIGLFAGHALGALIGHVADFIAAAALIGLGGYLLLGGEGEEEERIGLLSSRRGLALLGLGLGISISLDELAVGFTIGLLRLSIVRAVIVIGAQAFVVAQIGFTLGARLGEAAGEWAERLAGAALIGLGGWILA